MEPKRHSWAEEAVRAETAPGARAHVDEPRAASLRESRGRLLVEIEYRLSATARKSYPP